MRSKDKVAALCSEVKLASSHLVFSPANGLDEFGRTEVGEAWFPETLCMVPDQIRSDLHGFGQKDIPRVLLPVEVHLFLESD